MLQVIPTYRVLATFTPFGGTKQSIEIRVPETELNSILIVLGFNHATSVEYKLEDQQQKISLLSAP